MWDPLRMLTVEMRVWSPMFSMQTIHIGQVVLDKHCGYAEAVSRISGCLVASREL